MKHILALFALFAAAVPAAAQDMTLTSQVFVERVTQDAEGKDVVTLEDSGEAVIVPGDRLMITMTYRNVGAQPISGFVATNPIDSAISFESADSAGSTVSIDGGANWGDLAALTVALPDGTSRPAQPTDVTHVRWAFSQPIPAGTEGKLNFRGIVK